MGQQNPTYQELSEKISELEAQLVKTEWLHEKENLSDTVPYIPFYGDVTELNTERTILDNVGKETLRTLTSELMDLLDTSVAIYEKNGDYAYGVFNSGWCQLLDASSRKLCGTDDNKKALNCGRWLCHEDCWNNSGKAAIMAKKSTDIECVGGIKLYSEPIFAENEVVGAINIGYGNPPTDEKTLNELSEKFSIDFEALKQKALAYKNRPDYIIEISKKRLKSIAKLVGEIITRKKTEKKLNERIKELNCVAELSKVVENNDNIDDILTELARILKKSFQFPDITEVRITNNEFVYQTEKFRETEWAISSEIKVEHQENGKIEIVYLENRTGQAGPFLKEERGVLELISERAGKIIERLQKTKRFEELFDTLYEGILKADRNGIITEANQEAANICGYGSPEDLLGKPMTDLYANPSTRGGIVKKLEKAGGKFHNFEFILKKKDGSIIPTLCNIRMLLNRKGEYVGTLGAIRDISGRKQAEEALKKSENLLQSIITNSSSVIYTKDTDGRFVLVNKEFEKQFIPAEKVIGKNDYDFMPKELADKYHENDLRILKTGKPMQFEETANLSDGIHTVISNKFPLFGGNGEVTGIGGISTDITSRKQAEQALKASEEKYKRLVNNSSSLIMEANADTLEVISCNPAMAKALNTDINTITGKNIREFLPPEILKQRVEQGEKALKENKVIRFEDERNGRYFVNNFIPIFVENQRLIQTVTYDITEQKQAEQALKASEKKFAAYFNSNPSMTFVWKAVDNDFILTDLNDTSKKLTNNLAPSFIGLKASKIYNDLPDIFEKLKQCLNTKTTLDFEYYYKNRSVGTRDWLKFRLSYLAPDIILQYSDNIDEQKQAEQALKESEELFRTIFEQSAVGLVQALPTGEIIKANSEICDILGYTRSELLGKKVADLSFPEDMDKETEILKDVFNGSINSFSFEKRFIRKDQKVIWGYLHSNVVRNQDGSIKYALGAVSDITERKHSEQALKASEEKLRQIVNNTEDLIFVQNTDFQFIYYNGPEKYQLNPKDILGRTPYDFFDAQTAEKMISALKEVMRTKKRIRRENCVVWNSEKLYFIDEISPVFDHQNNIIAFSTISHNVTKLKKTEQALKESLIDLELAQKIAKIGNWKYDPAIGIPEWPERIYEIFERNPEAGPPHINEFKEIFKPDQYERYINAFQHAVNHGVSYDITLKLELKNNKTKWIYAICQPDKEKTARGHLLRGTIQDITKQKEAEEKIQEYAMQLEEANAAKDKFFNIIAHDLKNPFNALIGFSELLMDNLSQFNEKQISTFVANIYNASVNAFALLNNLLEWARTQTGKIVFNPKEIEIEKVIVDTIQEIKMLSKTKNISVNYCVAEPIRVFADKNMLNTIFRNLLTNAVKFTGEGGNVKISFARNKKETVVQVSDTGIGMDEEILKKLFRPGEKTSRKGTNDEAGTGLGLLLCKEFTERHGGRIWAESETGKGSSFFFTLPNTP